ncbi:MAG TPA: NAD(P)/FAD-dependent oxidoreductase [Actinomycetota bacterium]|nr:NAD(P)/FAD-dependent oxidoreductase [Actinomycetota bacterium]
MDTHARSIVIGAGFAGLSAAIALADEGVDLTVLEARERVGGRVWSITLTNGAVVELGGEWIMADDSVVHETASRFGVPLVETGASFGRREPWGEGAATLEAQDVFLEAADAALAALPPDRVAAMNVCEFLEGVEGDPAARSIVALRLAGTCARELREVSLASLASFGGERAFSSHDDVSHRAVEGNQAIARAMASELPDVRTGQVVDAIEHGRDGVTVRIGARSEQADVAVVAVPAPIASRLRFAPGLPDPLASALAGLPMGEASKLAVATKRRPPVRSRQSVDRSMWCWTGHGAGGKPRHCVTSFAGSSEAKESLGLTRGEVLPWLGALRSMNPDLMLVGEPVLYSWADDPFTLGAYSSWDRASWERRGVLAEPVGRLAFAGEHTAGDRHGTMEGALRSGRRAAEQVLRVLSR